MQELGDEQVVKPEEGNETLKLTGWTGIRRGPGQDFWKTF